MAAQLHPKFCRIISKFWFHLCLEVIDLSKMISKMTLGLLKKVQFLIRYSASDVFSVDFSVTVQAVG